MYVQDPPNFFVKINFYFLFFVGNKREDLQERYRILKWLSDIYVQWE